MARFSELYVESYGKLYKFEDAEVVVAQDPEQLLAEQQEMLDQQEANQQVIEQSVGVAQNPTVDETAQVAQTPTCSQSINTTASSGAAASAAQMVADSVIAPVATADQGVVAEDSEGGAETVQEKFNELYESLI